MPAGGIASSKQWWVGNNPITGMRGQSRPPFSMDSPITIPKPVGPGKRPEVGIMPIPNKPGKKPGREIGINPPPSSPPPGRLPKPGRKQPDARIQ